MDERPLKKGPLKRAFDSLIGRISHDIQIISVDQPMTKVCPTVGLANHIELPSIFPTLPAKPNPVAHTLLPVQLFENVSLLLLAAWKTLKTPL